MPWQVSCRGATRLSFACWLLALWRSWEQGPSGSTGLECFTQDKPMVSLVTLQLTYSWRWRKGRTKFCSHRVSQSWTSRGLMDGGCHVTDWNFPSEHRTNSSGYLHQENNTQGITGLLIPCGSLLCSSNRVGCLCGGVSGWAQAPGIKSC